MTKNGSNGSGGLGNTKRVSPCKKWCFTYNNYTESDRVNLINLLGSNGSKFIIGEEVGENGTPHLQGYIEFAKKQRPLEMKIFDIFKKKIHWEKTKGSEQENIAYCSKDGKYVLNGLKMVKPKRQPKILSDDDLYEWQQKIYDICKGEPDDRSIYWIFEDKGNVGKTQLAKKLSHDLGAVPVEGKKNDILYCCAEHESDIYIFDFERSMEDYISYGAMEKIKNGYYMCSKYESKPILRASPHVICFANFVPDHETLSKDRWKIFKIENLDLIPYSFTPIQANVKQEKKNHKKDIKNFKPFDEDD